MNWSDILAWSLWASVVLNWCLTLTLAIIAQYLFSKGHITWKLSYAYSIVVVLLTMVILVSLCNTTEDKTDESDIGEAYQGEIGGTWFPEGSPLEPDIHQTSGQREQAVFYVARQSGLDADSDGVEVRRFRPRLVHAGGDKGDVHYFRTLTVYR
jgi:hypothetical protein